MRASQCKRTHRHTYKLTISHTQYNIIYTHIIYTHTIHTYYIHTILYTHICNTYYIHIHYTCTHTRACTAHMSILLHITILLTKTTARKYSPRTL